MIRALEVLPHPRGPLNRYAWWIDPEAKAFDSGTVTCSCPITSAKVEGRYFLYRASDTVLLFIGTLRAPARAHLPLLPSGPGGVQYGNAARRICGQS